MNDISTTLRNQLVSWFDKTNKNKDSFALEGSGALGTTKGSVRDENQDRAALVHLKPQATKGAPLYCCVLCDGMGGMAQGGKAATLAISSFIASIASTECYTSIADLFVKAMQDANKAVYHEFRGKGGSTLSALGFSKKSNTALINIGDSRIYAYNNTELLQLSTDDTIGGQLEKLDRLPAESSPELNNLVQFIGMGEGIEPSQVKPIPPSTQGVLISSDGAYLAGNKNIAQLIEHSSTPIDLVKKVLLLSEWFGGPDNATVIYTPTSFNFDESSEEDALQLDIWTPSSSTTYNFFIDSNQNIPATNVKKTVNDNQKTNKNIKKKPYKKKNGSSTKPKENGTPSAEEQHKLEIEFDKGDN